MVLLGGWHDHCHVDNGVAAGGCCHEHGSSPGQAHPRSREGEGGSEPGEPDGSGCGVCWAVASAGHGAALPPLAAPPAPAGPPWDPAWGAVFAPGREPVFVRSRGPPTTL